ncbi:NAD(P)H-dependent oxidoreductase [Xylocopilactobacillus apicola]|uniref:NAD(P)H dehydrogenase (Quinone) n=1 Tax=Xylocopilactobacillus apicola TaxID=2932184 RepID=A0AAU9DSY2_9LACO|nr:NAD(P)H-dependent oxidoreductase [Xylocopilactobacillus apicola]BDR59209.1 NAD(P)H dehydrogenase (quinone) [Xylocopilactobacillus apicola]
MNILIIYTYPNHQSLNHKLLTTVKENIKSGNQVKVLDLYEENFDPSLRFDKEHPRHLMKNRPEMKKYQDLITWADDLIFIFPIWWAGAPALLKGFIDQVFSQGFAYAYKGRLMVGLLKNKRAWIITTCNAPRISAPFLQDYGRSLQWFVLKACGFGKVQRDILYSAEKNDRIREKFIKKIQRKAEKI